MQIRTGIQYVLVSAMFIEGSSISGGGGGGGRGLLGTGGNSSSSGRMIKILKGFFLGSPGVGNRVSLKGRPTMTVKAEEHKWKQLAWQKETAWKIRTWCDSGLLIAEVFGDVGSQQFPHPRQHLNEHQSSPPGHPAEKAYRRPPHHMKTLNKGWKSKGNKKIMRTDHESCYQPTKKDWILRFKTLRLVPQPLIKVSKWADEWGGQDR